VEPACIPHASQSVRSPDPSDKQIINFPPAFSYNLFLNTATINNNGTHTRSGKASPPLQFKRQAFDTSRIGNRFCGLQGSGEEVPGTAMLAEGLEEEEREDLIEGSSNQGCNIEASIPFEHVLP
jgi:hypothetical protein